MKVHQHPVELNGKDLSIEDIINVAENYYPVKFEKGKKKEIEEKRAKLEYQLTTYPDIEIYGTNVGCGDLKDDKIGGIMPEDFENLLK